MKAARQEAGLIWQLNLSGKENYEEKPKEAKEMKESNEEKSGADELVKERKEEKLGENKPVREANEVREWEGKTSRHIKIGTEQRETVTCILKNGFGLNSGLQ